MATPAGRLLAAVDRRRAYWLLHSRAEDADPLSRDQRVSKLLRRAVERDSAAAASGIVDAFIELIVDEADAALAARARTPLVGWASAGADVASRLAPALALRPSHGRLNHARARARIGEPTFVDLRKRGEAAILDALAGTTLDQHVENYDSCRGKLERLRAEIQRLVVLEPTLEEPRQLDREVKQALALHARARPLIVGIRDAARALAAANAALTHRVESWAVIASEAADELAFRWEVMAWRCEVWSRWSARLLGEGPTEPRIRIDREKLFREELAKIASEERQHHGMSLEALDAMVRGNSAERRYPGRGGGYGRYRRGS